MNRDQGLHVIPISFCRAHHERRVGRVAVSHELLLDRMDHLQRLMWHVFVLDCRITWDGTREFVFCSPHFPVVAQGCVPPEYQLWQEEPKTLEILDGQRVVASSNWTDETVAT